MLLTRQKLSKTISRKWWFEISWAFFRRRRHCCWCCCSPRAPPAIFIGLQTKLEIRYCRPAANANSMRARTKYLCQPKWNRIEMMINGHQFERNINGQLWLVDSTKYWGREWVWLNDLTASRTFGFFFFWNGHHESTQLNSFQIIDINIAKSNQLDSTSNECLFVKHPSPPPPSPPSQPLLSVDK